MELNIIILFAAALIPLVIGSIWYNPKLLGTAWMKSAGLREEQLQGGNMLLIFGLTYFFSLFLAFGIYGASVHQSGLYALFVTHPDFATAGSDINAFYANFMEQYGDMHRSFGHGLLHGVEVAIIMALPLIAIIALFERRGWKYIMIHFGYWALSMGLMGGIICQYI